MRVLSTRVFRVLSVGHGRAWNYADVQEWLDPRKEVEVDSTRYSCTSPSESESSAANQLSQSHPLAHLSVQTDEELAIRLRRGDGDALRIIFNRHAAMVRRSVFRILQDAAEADDCVQTVFWDVYRSVERFDPAKGTLRSWLLQYAHHRALNQKTSLKLRGFYSAAGVEVVDEQMASRNPLLPAEATHAIRQGLKLLSVDQRTTLQMIFLEGKEMEDVARHLGQRLSNVRHHYYRGMGKLRNTLKVKASGRGAV